MLFLKGLCPIMFELLLDVMERSLNLREAKLPWKELCLCAGRMHTLRFPPA